MRESLLLERSKVNQLCDEGFEKKVPNPLSPPKNIAKLKSVFDKINSISKPALVKVLGEFGNRLKSFVEFYSYDHPHIYPSVSNVFTSKLIGELEDVLTLCENINTNNLNHAANLIQQSFDNSKLVKNAVVALTSLPIRMLKHSSDIEFIRRKGISNINLQTGERIAQSSTEDCMEDAIQVPINNSFWFNQQFNSFEAFARLNVVKNNFDKYNKTIVKLKKMGLPVQADVYARKIKDAEEKSLNSYCGFKQIQLNEAAVILGKVNDFKLISSHLKIALDCEDSRNNDILNQLIPSTNLRKLICSCFSIDQNEYGQNYTVGRIVEETCKYLKKDLSWGFSCLTNFLLERNRSPLFTYQPRLWTMRAFSFCVSDKIVKMMNCLDNFPDFNGHMLFDKYYVLVPGINFNDSLFSDDGKYKFDTKKKSLEVESKEEALFLLDAYLVKNKLVCPIVVGKKDNDYYFLKYWED